MIEKNYAAIDQTLENLFEVTVPQEASSAFDLHAWPVRRMRPTLRMKCLDLSSRAKAIFCP